MKRIEYKKMLSNLNPSAMGLSAYARFILTMLISLMHIDRFGKWEQQYRSHTHTHTEKKKTMWLNKPKSRESVDTGRPISYI